MKNLIYDTNIVLGIIRSKKTEELIEYINPNDKDVYTSVIVEGEIKSIALRNKWGKEKMAKLDFYFNRFSFLEVTKTFVNTYVEIDTFSQRLNPIFPEYFFDTPRNTGKNDLWIASTASLLGLELVTTDADFNHLHNIFLDVRTIDADSLKKYF